MVRLHDMHPDTRAIHADRHLHETSALAPPIFQTSTFRAGSAREYDRIATESLGDHFYTRYGNPNHSQAAAVVAALERAPRAMIFPSGIAAMSCALIANCTAGDHIVAQRSMYAGTHAVLTSILEPLGVRYTLVDQADIEAFESALQANTRVILLETPSNPFLTVTDLHRVGALARERSILTIADNTFATPVNQHPFELGIDLVMQSATKYLGGHSDLSAGAIAGTQAHIELLWSTATKLGYAVNGFDSWLLLRGMRTVGLRVERQNENALAIAQFLQSHPYVRTVYYPGLPQHPQHDLARSQMRGFGGVVSFSLDSSERVEPFILKLSLIARASSLGGVETTLVQQSAMWPGSGVDPTLIRLSAGIEHVSDLIADLREALA